MSAIRNFERLVSKKPTYRRRTRCYEWNVKNTSTMVVGCSDQLSDQLRAYHVMGTSGAGGPLLSRQGVTYSAPANDVSCHRDVVERMLAKVLGNLPSHVRQRARARLVKRWNRDWGVDVDDLATGATIATARAAAVTSQADGAARAG
jgi:hypothetical protein